MGCGRKPFGRTPLLNKKMKPLRTRFAKDIVAECMPPVRPSSDVILFSSGMPSVPKLADTLAFYAKKGFWAFHPRYRGSWESDGSFLKKSPERDIVDIINQLPKGFRDILSGKRYAVTPRKLYLFGCSFGGPAALLASRDARVSKVVALSPVIDWQAPSEDEPLDWLIGYIRAAYGNGYRVTDADWKKLGSGKFYNPIRHMKEIDGKKLLIFQSKDDRSVPWEPAKRFAEATGAKLVLKEAGGHAHSGMFSDPLIARRIMRFLR